MIVRTAAESSSRSCPAVYNDSSSLSIQPTLDSAQQIATLSQKLEDTQNLLHLSQAHSAKSAFRYGTFLSGMLVALLLVCVAAFLFWSYIQQKLQRKQQVVVVGGLKDMDNTTLKKVLGEVGMPICSSCCTSVLLSLLTVTSLHCIAPGARHVVLVQVDLPSWVNFPDYERVNWLNSIVGKVPSP